jgi:hypothetical protein
MNEKTYTIEEYKKRLNLLDYILLVCTKGYKYSMYGIFISGYDAIIWKYMIPQKNYLHALDSSIFFIKDFLPVAGAYFFIFIGIYIIVSCMRDDIIEVINND